jgi:hypothetical protein
MMKQSKDLRVINAELSALIARGDVDPEQKKYVELALEELRRLKRKRNPTHADYVFCVRSVAENLLNAFYKRKAVQRF